MTYEVNLTLFPLSAEDIHERYLAGLSKDMTLTRHYLCALLDLPNLKSSALCKNYKFLDECIFRIRDGHRNTSLGKFLCNERFSLITMRIH